MRVRSKTRWYVLYRQMKNNAALEGRPHNGEKMRRLEASATERRLRRRDLVLCFRVMKAKGLTPILNVSDIAASFVWFEKWGWQKAWDWGTPPTFGAVYSGEQVQIFLCQCGQGGRGKGMNTTTFQVDGDEEGDRGAWMSVWVDDVDAVYKECVAAGLDVTFPPRDMPWKVREMHLRHPDGHVFRVSRGIGDEK